MACNARHVRRWCGSAGELEMILLAHARLQSANHNIHENTDSGNYTG